jgi:hypothetical protein
MGVLAAYLHRGSAARRHLGGSRHHHQWLGFAQYELSKGAGGLMSSWDPDIGLL